MTADDGRYGTPPIDLVRRELAWPETPEALYRAVSELVAARGVDEARGDLTEVLAAMPMRCVVREAAQALVALAEERGSHAMTCAHLEGYLEDLAEARWNRQMHQVLEQRAGELTAQVERLRGDAAFLADGLLQIAEKAMPDTYYATDSRCQRARAVLAALDGHEEG